MVLVVGHAIPFLDGVGQERRGEARGGGGAGVRRGHVIRACHGADGSIRHVSRDSREGEEVPVASVPIKDRRSLPGSPGSRSRR